jgi:hypothetical protein
MAILHKCEHGIVAGALLCRYCNPYQRPMLKLGDQVILLGVPPTLMENLPDEDKAAITAAIGTPVIFMGFSYGQAEVKFLDLHGNDHTIWVDQRHIKLETDKKIPPSS